MSIEIVEEQIENPEFVEHLEELADVGKWGVGKTHLWVSTRR